MPPNSTTYLVIAVAVVAACLAGAIAGFARLRPGVLHARRYVAIMGVAWLLLAVSAIANAIRGSLWGTVGSLVLLVLIPTAVYSKLRNSSPS
ncbi:conserved hypothetical protein [Mycobacterium marinum M]|uniref:Uncharacterized protein n=1 Tax=Mycobacterium marinum (strain ATCC BAA-535 / M) TaxID=216594 RepID=B2HR84_MYCMM|nr:conserved hypothetical protein [Mycobacterium marinum M]GJO16296.1 hypothetical protein NJB1507_04080 [Mycobacterium marinum]